MSKTAKPKKFLKQRRKDIWISVFSIFCFILFWEIIGRLDLLDELFFSFPSKIIVSVFGLFGDKEFWQSFTQTFFPFFLSLVLSSFFAIVLGILLGIKKNLYYFFRPYIFGLNSLPKIVLLPIFILWFGLGNISKIIIIFLTAFVPILINVIEGVKSVDSKKVKMAKSFHASGFSIAEEIYFYTIAPYFLAGLKSTIGKTIGITIISEYSGVGLGLGRQLAIYSTRLETDNLFALAFILIAISLTTIFVFDILYSKTFRRIT